MEYKTDMEALIKALSKQETDPSRPVTADPTPNTRRLFDFLMECRGKRFIAGQQYFGRQELEDVVYYRASGKLPALRGYDFMGISGLGGNYDQIGRALECGKRCGCIITMCWHWYAPDDMAVPDRNGSFYYKTTDYDRRTSFDIIRAAQDGTAENEFVIREIDMVARALKVFEREDVPVIWRPLHEANGGWFWWGNRGAESVRAYKWLWCTIFDRFMNYHKLKNLIWVWNGQDKQMSVSPNTFDIVGDDLYPDPPGHSSQQERFKIMSGLSGGKPAALTEVGSIPDPELMSRDKAEWLWWMPWWGQFVYDINENHRPALDENGYPRPNPKYLDEDFIRRVFSDERVITLDKLPWRDKDAPLPPMLTENLRKYGEL